APSTRCAPAEGGGRCAAFEIAGGAVVNGLFSQFGQAGAPYGDHALGVPKFRRSEQPARVREILLSYHRMRDAAVQVRRDYVAEGAGVEEQWGGLQVLHWLDACIAA